MYIHGVFFFSFVYVSLVVYVGFWILFWIFFFVLSTSHLLSVHDRVDDIFFIFRFFTPFWDLTTSLNRIFRGDEKHVLERSLLIEFRPFKRQNRKVRNVRTSQFANFSVLAPETIEIDSNR